MTCEPTKNIYPLRRKNMYCGVPWKERKSLTRHASLQVTETFESKKSFSLQVEGRVGPIWRKRKGKMCLAFRVEPVPPRSARCGLHASSNVGQCFAFCFDRAYHIFRHSCSHVTWPHTAYRIHQYTISVRPRAASGVAVHFLSFSASVLFA